jgi:hypothetical protein
MGDDEGKASAHPFHFSTYSAPGGLRQDPGRAAQSLAEARRCGNGVVGTCQHRGTTRNCSPSRAT